MFLPCSGCRSDGCSCGVWLRKVFCDLSQVGAISSAFARQHVHRRHPHNCSLLRRQPHRWVCFPRVCSSSLPLQLKLCPWFLRFAGRILNRFSKDIGLMDSKLPIIFVDFYQVRKCWNAPFPQRSEAFSFNHTCVFFSCFCRTSALWWWQLQSSPSCSSPSFCCCWFSCTWSDSTSAYPEMWNVLRLQVISACFCLMQ